MRSLCGHRLPDHKYYNRDRYRLCNTPEPASSNRCSGHHNLSGYVRRPEELIPNRDSENIEGSGVNSFGAFFFIRRLAWQNAIISG